MGKALDGIRVLDLSQYMAGPLATTILADLGAEVIKIEPPWGEPLRTFPPDVRGVTPSIAYLARNKKGMTLDLKKERGIQIFKELVKHADVVVENFSTGVMERLGIGYETLKDINPSIIYASVSGFGRTGPYADRLSYDLIAQAYSGIMSLTAELNNPGGPPIVVADYIGDYVPPLVNTICILAALYYRKLTGRGQLIDVSQMGSMIFGLQSIVTYMLTGETGPQLRKKLPIPAYGTYKAKDGYVALAVTPGAIYDRFAKVLGKMAITQDDIKEWVGQRTVEEVVSTFVEARVPVAPVLTVEEVVKDPHVLASGWIVEVEHPTAGKLKVIRFPPMLSETPPKVELPPPLLGQHNEEILSTILGYSKEEIANLRKEGVI